MTIQEENIKKQLTEHLYWDNRVDASKVQIEVNGTKVTLKGTVPTYQERIAAVNNAWKTANVSAVENEIKVSFAPKVTVPKDAEIEENLCKMLAWDPYIDEKEVKVKVKNGEVDLSGKVDAYWKKIRAEKTAEILSGIKEIVNKIAVVPSESILDDIIARNVTKAIDRNGYVDIDNVTVEVDKGEVKIVGKVKDWVAYISAQEAAENTAGVINVKNRLTLEF